MAVWVDTFTSLYEGIPDIDSGYERVFLEQVKLQATSIERTNKLNFTDTLNTPVTSTEVRNAVKEAGNGKAVSVDRLPNETFKNNSSIECLTALFNICLKESIIPDMWRKTLISPIYKGKNKDRRDPKSYRPVSLICNSCKIFTNILNKRLLRYLETNFLLAEEQNGFRKGRSCEDHVFVLDSIIREKLLDKKHVYGCFVDFSFAFDFINRDLLIHVLAKFGIKNNFIRIMEALLTNTESAIKFNGKTTRWFPTKAGIRQGQNDSTTLFALYVNSLADKIKNLNLGIKIGDTEISILMYADDIILIAETQEGLQCMLNELHTWCKRWRMTVNTEKTQIIHFRPKRSLKTKTLFHYGSSLIDIVESYQYLGITVNEHLDKQVMGDKLADGATRALGKLLSKYYLNKGLGLKMYRKFYETCINPIMDYCSGVWGYGPNEKLHKIHMRALRCYLGVNKYTAKAGIEGELAWATPQIRRTLNMLRLWNRIVGMENSRLPKVVYCNMKISGKQGTWINEVRNIFEKIQCSDIFENNVPIINIKDFLNYALEKLMSQYVLIWKQEIHNKPKLAVYSQYKTEFATEVYCEMNIKRSQRSLVAKLRLGTLPIRVETGRYNGIEREKRLCLVCKDGSVEDESHVMFHCQAHNKERKVLFDSACKLNPHFLSLGAVHKIAYLTNAKNIIRKSAQYLFKVLHNRQQVLSKI